MIVHVKRRARFSAAHSYENVDWSVVGEISATGLKQEFYTHGHNYIVDLTCKGELEPASGMVVNITEIDKVLKSLLKPLDQTFLEKQHPEAAWGIPTTENLSMWIWKECDGKIPDAELVSIRVFESDYFWSEYRGENNGMVYLTKSYEFSAAHRLHNPLLSDEDNCRIYGKCNNLNGHGHNYILEVTLRGETDSRTGMCCNIGHLDKTVLESVVDRFDHKHLNLDVPEFEMLNPTSENLAVVVWNILNPLLDGKLFRVCIRETERNYFEFYG